MKTYIGPITNLLPNQIFVFGSNTQGRHGRGAAKLAREKFGAKYGQAKGLQGNSYAIITKDLTKRSATPTVSKITILIQIVDLYVFAKNNPHFEFLVAYDSVGPYLNGYKPQDMADLFFHREPPENVVFEEGFAKLKITQ